jgi:hypothetical protein
MTNTHTAQPGSHSGYSRDPNIRTLPVTATWANQPARPTRAPHTKPPAPAASTPAANQPAATVGQRVELARYTVPSGERVLIGQRVNGVVRLSDVPASPGGRAYLVERGLERDGNSALSALIADYLQGAQTLAEVPMAVSPLNSNHSSGGDR